MNQQENIYVIGHKNPDTDSICSAIAYADIKNRTERKVYTAKRAGQINEETEYVLNRFGMEAPGYISDVGAQVRDMEIHKTQGAPNSITIKRAWELMKESGAVTLPITTQENKLEGIITIGDIAKYYMDAYDKTIMSDARTQYRAMADTLGGTIVTGNEHGYFIKGKVLVGAANPEFLDKWMEDDDLIIVGDREDVQMRAIMNNASCIVVSLGADISEEVTELARKKSCMIISSPYDTYTVARLINQSIPVKHLMKKTDLVTFQTDDFVDDIKDVMGRLRHRDFPVLNKKGCYLGTISRRNLINVNKKKLILVDHNEESQAVDNIGEADILEIVDHHRLGSLETIQPIAFRNQPVGCTATILFQIYNEKQLEIPENIAGLLCAAIISDTLMFRSPTCTKYDQEAALELAEIAHIDVEAFANEMFRAGSNLSGKSPEEIFYQDFKKFIMEDVTFGVGQINSMNAEELEEIEGRLKPFMENECGKHGISMVFFMLTNIIGESTRLMCYGENSTKLVEEAFHVRVDNGISILPGVVSRKKQLIPTFLATLQNNN